MDGPKRILIVDDDPQVLFVLVQCLTALGTAYELTTARNGCEALAKAHKMRLDLVITDLGMPGQSGVQVTEGIKALHPGIAVIWITAHQETAWRTEAKRLHVHRCLQKPVDIGEMRRVARQALQGLGGPPAAARRAG